MIRPSYSLALCADCGQLATLQRCSNCSVTLCDDCAADHACTAVETLTALRHATPAAGQRVKRSGEWISADFAEAVSNSRKGS